MSSNRKKVGIGILVALLVLLICVRLVLPGIILKKLNNYLATFSPVYSLHIGDLNLSFLTMSYEFENADAFYKKDGHNFFKVESLQVSIAWRELLRARILTDVRVSGGNFTLSKALIEGSKTPEAKPKEKANEAAGKLFPVRIALVEIHSSAFDFADFVSQAPATRWRVSEIEAKILNLNPTPHEPLTFFTAQGTLLDSAKFKVAGKAKRLEKPLAWKLDTEIHDFNLVNANPMLMHELPFTFREGKLDVYSELRSQNGLLEGYVKPFLKNVSVLPANDKYKNLRHFAYEVIGALANVILRKSDDKSVATRIAFHREPDGHLKVDTGQAISKVIQHGFEKGLSPSIEDSLDLK